MTFFPTAETIVEFIGDTAIRGTLLLLLAFVISVCLRRSSAAVRHSVWSIALIGLLILPFASTVLPSWTIAVLPSANQHAVNSAATTGGQGTAAELMNPDALSAMKATNSDATSDNAPKTTTSILAEQSASTSALTNRDEGAVTDAVAAGWISRFVVFVWLTGTGLFLTSVVISWKQAASLRRISRPITEGPFYEKAMTMSRRLGIRRRINTRRHPESIVPLTLGIVTPAILLPAESDDWNDSLQDGVLLHELAHVRRNDLLWQLVGRIACSLHWFNPLAWYAQRQLRQLSEQACDDAVVQSGEKASDYAATLLQIARTFCGDRRAFPGVAMAEGNNLERRVRSLFETRRSHAPLQKGVLSVLLFFDCLTLAIVGTIKPVTAVASQSADAIKVSGDHQIETGKLKSDFVNSEEKDTQVRLTSLKSEAQTDVPKKGTLTIEQKAAKAKIEELGGEVRPYDSTTFGITLGKTKTTDKDLKMFKCFNMVALGLLGTQVTDAGLAHLKSMNRLGELDLCDTGITDAGLVHLKDLPALECVNLTRTKVTDQGVKHLATRKKMYMLILNQTNITDAAMADVGKLMNLKTLILAQTKITDDGLAHLKTLKSLNHIRLNGTAISDKSIVHLSGMTELRTVELSQTNIDGSGLGHLPTSVKSLWLPLTQITDAGLSHITHLKNLETLVLSKTNITDKGLKPLEQLISLRSLQIGGTNVSKEGVAAMKAALPNCKVSD